MNLKKTASDLRALHGSYRKAAAATGISYAQLCKLATGRHKNPTTATLRKLGVL